MLEIIIKGIIIGLFVSVPLGPIGMLCIQRTLNRGRKFGILTGLGATTSDLVYTIITLFFLSFVIETIEANRFWIQLVGSLIVTIFGYFIFKSHPSKQPKPDERSKHSLFGDFVTSFGLTFSNPLVLFVLIALFARLRFVNTESVFFIKSPWLYYTFGILSIHCGAFLWWSTLTFLVSHFKTKLSMMGLKIINQITGIIIILIGCVGFILSLIEKKTV